MTYFVQCFKRLLAAHIENAAGNHIIANRQLIFISVKNAQFGLSVMCLAARFQSRFPKYQSHSNRHENLFARCNPPARRNRIHNREWKRMASRRSSAIDRSGCFATSSEFQSTPRGEAPCCFDPFTKIRFDLLQAGNVAHDFPFSKY